MKFDVTFYFKNCISTVKVEVDHEDEAIGKARLRDCPPVPDDILASCAYSGPGGKRAGAGVKQGSTRTSEPRNVKKQIGHTQKGWQFIEQECKKSGLDIQTYQREILALGIITMKDRRYRQ
jgi:hypothetical protein